MSKSPSRILLLGGTNDAGLLARRLAECGVDTVYSYAGRTAVPQAQPVPVRVGGFGGVYGLVEYIHANKISHVIDATHPFAAQMSGNAVAACALAGTPLLALERTPWAAGAGDRWHSVPDVAGAIKALPQTPARVFLAIGRQNLDAFVPCGQHFFLLRLVDETPHQPLVNAHAIISRGPFTYEGDLALLREHAITHIIAKNAGGEGARAKLDAARTLHLPVIMIDRPHIPARATAGSIEAVMNWLAEDGLAHEADLGV